jgi:2Fe-2S ferredoxin
MLHRIATPDPVADADAPNLLLAVTLTDGSRFETPAAAGFRIMEIVRAYGLPIKAECGGAGVCATCHVRIRGPWQDLVPPPSAEELAKLDDIPGADEFSRLACQIEMTSDLDGLAIEIQPDSLHAQTYWVAG